MTEIHVETKELPACVRVALERAGYKRKDIGVSLTETLRSPGAYGTGYRAFVCVINLATGAAKTEVGAWGGANPFSNSPLDRGPESMPLPPGFVAITGSVGHKALLSLYMNPANAAPWLPAPSEVTARQAWILGCYAGLTSAGRKDEFARRGPERPTLEEIDELVSRGLLSRNKAGATALTTEGRNAAGDPGARQRFVPRGA